MNTLLSISHPKIINANPILIALAADLQSTVVYDKDGNELAWIHAHKKTIHIISEHWGLSPILSAMWPGYKCYLDSATTKEWGLETSFIYPPAPAPVPTIATEELY